VFNKLLTNFESLVFATDEGSEASALDAGALAANYTTLGFNSNGYVSNVDGQALVLDGEFLDAQAAGYTKDKNAGSLDITVTTEAVWGEDDDGFTDDDTYATIVARAE